jgi:membrane protease YdiL (CAAX protease family)
MSQSIDSASVEGAGHPVLYRGAAATFVNAVRSGVILRPQLWGLADVLIALALSLLVPSLVVGLLLAAGAPKNGTIIILASLLSPWVGFGLWPALATRRRGNGPHIDLGLAFTREDFRWGILGGCAALAIGSVVALITEHFTGPFDSAAGSAISNAHVPRLVVILFAVLAVAGAPVMEELCFRGLTFTALARFSEQHGWPPIPVASVVSAALFAAIHLEPIRFPLLLSIGLVLSVVRAKTGRIGPTILAHGINNLIPVIGLLTGTVLIG